jgi:outer membrane protein OmpA-like peptidoglycan-associated protein
MLVCLLGFQNLSAQQGMWQERQLSNGMLARYCEDTTRQLLHIGLTLKGGAQMDQTGNMGLAHLYEHLFFQHLPDSSTVTEAIDKGIFLSHNTQLEGHFFGLSISPEACAAALQIFGRSLMQAEWSDSALISAKAEIASELQYLESTPENNLRTELQSLLWKQSAIQKHVFGSYPAIRSLGNDAILTVVQRFRNPQGCLLTGTGKMPAQEFFGLAESALGAWLTSTAPSEFAKQEFPQLQQSTYFTSVNEFAVQPMIMMAWPVAIDVNAALTSREAQAFCKLGQLRQGRFYQALVGRGLAHNLEWSWAGGVLPGQLLLSVVPVKDSLVPCLQAIHDALVEMAEGTGIRKEDISAVQRILRLQNAQNNDLSIGRLAAAGQNWLLSSDLEGSLPKLNVEQLRAFCKIHLARKSHVAGLLLNSEAMAYLEADRNFKEPKLVVPIVVSARDSITGESHPRSSDPATLRSFRILFAQEEFGVDPSAIPLLDDLASMLLANPEKRIYLNSFSEGIGDGVKNYQLSVSRAKAAREWLFLQRGVPMTQVVIRAYGEAFAEFPDENDLRNRRLSFEFAPQDAQDNVF